MTTHLARHHQPNRPGTHAVMAGILPARKFSMPSPHACPPTHLWTSLRWHQIWAWKDPGSKHGWMCWDTERVRWEPDPLHPNHGKVPVTTLSGLGVSSDLSLSRTTRITGCPSGQDEISRCGCSPQSDGKVVIRWRLPLKAELESPNSDAHRVWQWCVNSPWYAKRSLARTLSSGRTHGDRPRYSLLRRCPFSRGWVAGNTQGWRMLRFDRHAMGTRACSILKTAGLGEDVAPPCSMAIHMPTHRKSSRLVLSS